MPQNPHAEKAKELLCHYFGRAIPDRPVDRQKVGSIVDEIIAAMHLEIKRELDAVFGRDDKPT